ncbi:MAG: 50S ribosomal protein L6 [Myxococcota bacterium]
MSRIGKQPIHIPSGVETSVSGQVFVAKGGKGQMEVPLHPLIELQQKEDHIVVSCKEEDTRQGKSLHGLFRSLCANAVKGVHENFTRELELNGVGYRVELKSNQLHMSLGFSHPVIFDLPSGITAAVDGKKTRLVLSGVDKQLVGNTAARIRAKRPVEPYRGKGIRYSDEIVKRKEGKTAGK